MSTDTVTLKLRVENLGVAFHKHTRIAFTYTAPYTGSLVPVDGTLTKITRGAPGQPTILRVGGLFYAVPAGTLITIETGELR